MSDNRVHPEDVEGHLQQLSLSPREVSIVRDGSTGGFVSNEHDLLSSPSENDGVLSPSVATYEEVGAKWVDVTEQDDYARSHLGEKDLTEDLVVIEDQVKEYAIAGREEGVKVLKGVNMHQDSEVYAIKKGEFVMIRGPSGGGKTTQLNMIGTIDGCSSGTIKLFNKVIDSSCSDSFLAELRLAHIGFVFQTFNLQSTMSAYENVSLPMVLQGKLSDADIRTRTLQLLALVGLQDRAAHLPAELSGGEQQRVTIARSLSNRPELLLLDEPTGDLDTRNTIEVMDALLRINREYKTSCVMVTHNPDQECYADRILYIEDGCIKKQAINSRQMRLNYEHYMVHIGNVYGQKGDSL